jgi:hypothetical protein
MSSNNTGRVVPPFYLLKRGYKMLEILAAFENDELQKIEFTDIKKHGSSISKIIFLWDHNSYIADVKNRLYVINGGRYIAVPWFKDAIDFHLDCYKRHRKILSMNGKGKDIEVITYLIGFRGIINSEQHEIFLYVSGDGKLWKWLDKR